MPVKIVIMLRLLTLTVVVQTPVQSPNPVLFLPVPPAVPMARLKAVVLQIVPVFPHAQAELLDPVILAHQTDRAVATALPVPLMTNVPTVPAQELHPALIPLVLAPLVNPVLPILLVLVAIPVM